LSSLELIEVPAVISSTSSLSIPSGNRFVDSLIMVNVYIYAHAILGEIIDLPSTALDLIQEVSDCDHRKRFYINAALMDVGCVYVTGNFGCLGQSRFVGASNLFEIRRNFDRFDNEAFLQVRSIFLISSIFCSELIPLDDFTPTRA
jgi:hypothetical protein